MKFKNLIFVLLFIVLVSSANASVVGVSPSIARFNAMLKNGYAETSVTASTSFEVPLKARITLEGEVAEWITLRPEDDEFVFSRNDPYNFVMVMEPPEDTQNGNYTGILKITTDEIASVESGAGSSVIAQVGMLIYVEVTGEEIIACRAGGIYTSNTEIDTPLLVYATVQNDGNVRLRPEVQVKIYDQYQTQVLYTTSFFGSQVLPTLERQFSSEIEHNLQPGQYFADILVKECGVNKKITFDVLEKGQISDSGELVVIRTSDIVYAKETLLIQPMFKNSGNRKVVAQFKGEIRDLKTDKIIQVIESDALEVEPRETYEFKIFYVPEKAGDYQISGRVVYNKKITFEEKSKIIKVKNQGFSLGWLLLLILYMIIGLVILILIGKIRKARKKGKKKIKW